jgi:hypothetical protein
MAEHLIAVKVIQPGRATGQYYSPDLETFRLEKVIYPEEILPFDVCVLPTALTSFDEPFPVLLLGEISHPMNTEIEARLLGAVQRGGENPILLSTPSADERAPECLENLPVSQRGEILRILSDTKPGRWHWLTVEEVEPFLHLAAMRYREVEASGRVLQLDPAWKPLNIGHPEASFAEVERYTAAEYTFYELPFHFQHYVHEFLAPEERILYATRRPAITSRREQSFLKRVQLQAGVLILTNQRLIHLAELVPPDSANIRYGFHTAVGVLERLERASISSIGNNLVLRSEWRAEGGRICIEWETPDYTRGAMEELVEFLRRFQVDADDYALRRMTPLEPPKKLPELIDPASSEPESETPLIGRFSAALTESLAPNEQVHAWALLPEWFERKNGAQVLVVTERRMFLLSKHSFDVPLSKIAALEYTSSILESSLAVNYIDKGKPHRAEILFPYPAQEYFRACYEAARRCLAVIPAV